MSVLARFKLLLGLAFATLLSGQAFAGYGQPTDWGINLQYAATPMMERMHAFHNGLVVIITAISLFVLALLIWVVVRYNRKSNPTPSKTSHNTMIEVAWTVIPMLILIGIAVPSFRILYDQRVIPETDLTVKTIGYQWYWGVEYPDSEGVAFDQIMIRDEQGQPAGNPRLLETDNAMVVPVDQNIRLIVTAADVIHSWTIPSFGVKIDAIPGRLNEAWFRPTRLGTYYGQCSELCGRDHAFMPIMVKVVPQDVYAQWLEAAATNLQEANQIVTAWEQSVEGNRVAAAEPASVAK